MRFREWMRIFGLALLAGLPLASAFAQEVESEALEAVDYGDIDNWLCHPGNTLDVCGHDVSATIVNADGSVELEAWTADPDPGIDCFYVYPTT